MLNTPLQKRKFERVPISLPIIGKITPNLFISHSFGGKSQNISYSGLCIKTTANGFRVGQEIRFGIWLYKNDFLLKTKGTIRWINSNNDSPETMSIGIELFRTRHYRKWCERVDSALSLAKLHDIGATSY